MNVYRKERGVFRGSLLSKALSNRIVVEAAIIDGWYKHLGADGYKRMRVVTKNYLKTY